MTRIMMDAAAWDGSAGPGSGCPGRCRPGSGGAARAAPADAAPQPQPDRSAGSEWGCKVTSHRRSLSRLQVEVAARLRPAGGPRRK
jgi:hypothetical protein